MIFKQTSRYILFTLFLASIFAQGTWQWTGRVHSELDWYTLKTAHFNVHYHNGIEEIAIQGASLAEQALPILMEQIGVDTIPTIDIIFTSEDEIMNGYAMWTYQTFIWVDQNDASIWLEDEKWLKQVLTHELQHIVYFHAQSTWLPEPFGFLFSGTPGWFVEGLAEIGTERWRPYRADLTHKTTIFKDEMQNLSGHHQGFSKTLLMSYEYGDSVFADIMSYRNKLGMFNFRKAFKKSTGVSVDQFNEHWRRTMNTYYYGYKAQKERIEDVGLTSTLPLSRVTSFLLAPDSLTIALVGRDTESQLDESLIVAEIDTTREKENNKDQEKEKSQSRPKPRFEKKEVDFGLFHTGLSWSPDGHKLAYAKYRFGSHGSMLWDLKLYDREAGNMIWLTKDERATYPDWSPDGTEILYTAHANSITNLYTMKVDGTDKRQITSFIEDTQIITPRWSPDGSAIAFAVVETDGNCDIAVLDPESGNIEKLTSGSAVDYLPVWHPDGKKISYTSHEGGTPNMATVDVDTKEIYRNTDVAEAVWLSQWSPSGSTILARTLNDVDSVRVVQIDPQRVPTTSEISIRDNYTSWRTQRPSVTLDYISPYAEVDILSKDKYRFYKHPKHLTSFVLPLDVLFGMTAWSDALGKHIFQVMAGTTWDGKFPFGLIGYINAQHGPMWGINYYYNLNWSFRFYDDSDSGLLEKRDGVHFWVSQPMNFGNSMSSNHLLTAGLGLFSRDVENIEEPEGFLPVPESGDEGLILLNYRWVTQRPMKNAVSLPKNGWGINLTAEASSDDIYGDFSYQKYTLDSYTNIPAGFGVFFLRAKGILLEGSPPAQEYVGLSNDMAIYGPGNSGTFGLPENHNLRGDETIRFGDRLIFGTGEFRFPLLDSFPINVLGISIGEVTGAVISDFGNSWYSAGSSEDFILTGGYEAKVAIQLGSAPLFFVAVGQAQTFDGWKDELDPINYVRFALINPF